ncbi:MAG: hypothetical protein JNK56_15005, partial [Myxococcales bacterium]|nr:hypothetical protein [Myxococcales bacterium]
MRTTATMMMCVHLLAGCGDAGSATAGTGTEGATGTAPTTGTQPTGAESGESGTSNLPTGGSEATGDPPASGPFAACGGAIFAEGGVIDAAEYVKQARLWDRPTIDCRLGPKY